MRDWKDELHGPYVCALVDPVYLFIYASSEGLDACSGIDVLGKGDDGDDAWCAVGAVEDACRSDEGGAFSGLSLLLGVAPVEASLCDSAYCRRFCALASSATWKKTCGRTLRSRSVGESLEERTFCDVFESRFSGMMGFEGFVFL
jgi:hypothetical protein